MKDVWADRLSKPPAFLGEFYSVRSPRSALCVRSWKCTLGLRKYTWTAILGAMYQIRKDIILFWDSNSEINWDPDKKVRPRPACKKAHRNQRWLGTYSKTKAPRSHPADANQPNTLRDGRPTKWTVVWRPASFLWNKYTYGGVYFARFAKLWFFSTTKDFWFGNWAT